MKLLLVVAVALIDADNRVLIAQRPEGKQLAGLWEFPGGKVESGETIFEALQRELQEELGISIHSATELMVIEHDYPHAYVRIHVSIIREWSGEPSGCESQALSWQALFSDCLSVEPLLPAALPMIERLRQFYGDSKTDTRLA